MNILRKRIILMQSDYKANAIFFIYLGIYFIGVNAKILIYFTLYLIFYIFLVTSTTLYKLIKMKMLYS